MKCICWRTTGRYSIGLRPDSRVGVLLILALILGSCAIASAPLATKPKVVPTPVEGQLTVHIDPEHPIGNLQPVYVSVANGADEGRAIHPSQVFAISQDGNRIAPIPPQEAARQAGARGKLKAALVSSATGGAVGGALGAAAGAIAGSFLGGAGTGAALGGAIGAGEGVFNSTLAGPAEAQTQADTQIGALALYDSEVRKDFTTSGYVFFPKGSYTGFEMLVTNSETGATETVKLPWH